MKTYKGLRGILAALGLLLLATAVHAQPRLSITPLGLQIVQLQEVPGTPRAIDVTARTAVINRGDPAQAVRATLISSSPKFIVLDGELFFGDVPRSSPLRPVVSQDTFKLRILLPNSRKPSAILALLLEINQSLDWRLTCANCGNTNSPPLANAGADQTVYVTQAVTLDGSASADPDGQSLRYTWSFVSRPAGSNAALSSSSLVRPVFTPDREGDYVVRLVVNDGIVNSAPDTVLISTLNSAPVARAGADQQTRVGMQVLLDGTASSDIDGDMLTYAWTLAAAPSGSVAQISDPSQALAKFTPDLAGDYIIELVVDDGTVSSTPDSVVITTTVRNSVPVANAGSDQSAQVGAVVQLDGAGSTDADGDALSYAWTLNSRPTGSAAALQGAGTATPALNIDKPGTYVAQLIVSDGNASSAPDTVAISTTNSAPVASISAPATVKWGSTVTLDGTASADRDGDALGFDWSLLSHPDGSDAAIDDANGTTATFTADKPGVYVTQLVVNDGHANSEPAAATITATNNAPVANDDSAGTSAGTAVNISVLANDTDADGDTLSIASVGQPAHGTTSIVGNAVRYTPAAGFIGGDRFGYAATDGAETASATVAVAVTAVANSNPVAQLEITPATTEVGTLVSLSFAGSSDPDTGDHVASYSVVLRSAPAGSQGGSAGGTQFTLNVAQTTTSTSLSFVPDAAGVFSFELGAIDTRGAASTAVTAQLTATQPPPPNQAPTAVLQISPATIELGSAVATLAFSGSSDPDAGDAIADYTVTLIEAPAGSAGGGSGGQTFTVGTPFTTALSSLAFAPDVAGTYRFRLTVRDTHGAASDAVIAQLLATAAEPPTGTVAKVTIDRTTVFLPGIGRSVNLHAQAFDDTGAPVSGAVAWTSSAPTQILVDATGRVIATDIGSAQVFAEIGGVRSTPAFVVAAETLPNTLLVSDAQVLSVGGAIGLAPDQVPGVGTRYEVRLTGVAAAPAVGTIVLAAENAPVAGRVVATRSEGTTLVVTLELARLPEMLGRYRIDWSIDLSPYPLVFDAPPAGANVMRANISEARGTARTARLAGVLDAITCDGSVSAQLADFGATLGFDNQMRLDIQDFREDSALPPGFSRHVLTGAETISGTVEFKFNPGFSASGSCIAAGHINLPVFGWLSLLVTPSVRLGVGVDLSGQFTVASGELSINGRLGSSHSLGWTCSAGPNSCTEVKQFEPISEFKHTEIVPSLHDMHVTLSGHAYLLLGLDFAILQAEHAQILEAKVGPKQTVDLGRESDQAENQGYASQYDLKLEGSLKPGSALQEALDTLLGGDGANVSFNLVFDQPLSKSPRGTFESSKTRIPLGESVDLVVRLTADSINYALIGYNVDSIELWRKKENEDEFTFFDRIGVQGSIQTTFTYRWEPTTDDVGKSAWAAFVRTTMPVPALEVSANSVKELEVGCFSSGVQAAPQGRSASLQRDSRLAAENVCADVWTGTASTRLDGVMATEASVTWKRDPTFEPGPGQEGVVQYLPQGSVTVDNIQYRNMGCTVTPSDFTLSFDNPEPSDVNRLWVDYSTTPATFVVGGNMRRLVQISCPNDFNIESVEPISWVQGNGDVSEDGRIIHGSTQSPVGGVSFTFTHP